MVVHVFGMRRQTMGFSLSQGDGGFWRWAKSHQVMLGRVWDWGGGTVWPVQLISPDGDVLDMLRSKRCLFYGSGY